LPRLDTYLCDLKESQIRDGLHVFGESPTGRLRIDTLLALRIPVAMGVARNQPARALAKAFELGFDPLDCALAEPWNGPRPHALLRSAMNPGAPPATPASAWNCCHTTDRRRWMP
jgi:cobaltochelatase CobN